MKKSIRGDDVYYTILWSPVYVYNRHLASRILPELPGIVCLMEQTERREPEYLIFYGCWREGLRITTRNFFDPIFSQHTDIVEQLHDRKLLYKYAVIDTTPKDVKDVMYWLINHYKPLFNDDAGFKDSKRYKHIYVRELVMEKGEMGKRIPSFGL